MKNSREKLKKTIKEEAQKVRIDILEDIKRATEVIKAKKSLDLEKAV